MEVYSKERILRIREIDWEEEWSQVRQRLEDFAEEAGGDWVVKVAVEKENARRVEGSSERPQARFEEIAEAVEQGWTDSSGVSIEITARCKVGGRGHLEETGRTKVFEHGARLSAAILVLGVFAASVACTPIKTVSPDGRVVRHHFGYVRIVDPPKASSKGRFDLLEVSSYGIRIHHGVGLGYFHTREEQIPLDCRLVVRVQNKEQMREVLDNLAPIIKEGLCVTVD